jgi:hypothetical protein
MIFHFDFLNASSTFKTLSHSSNWLIESENWGYIKKEIVIVQFFWCFKKGMCAKLLGIKSWGFIGRVTWVTSRKTKDNVGFYHIEIKGVKSSEP